MVIAQVYLCVDSFRSLLISVGGGCICIA